MLFADKFVIPQIIYLVQYIANKLVRKNSSMGETVLKFDRLNSNDSLFEQLFKHTFKKSTEYFSESEERPFRARFLGENAYDAGGPFRDLMENICTEINEEFFKPTSNMDSIPDVSSYQPKLTTSPADLKRYLFIGKMIGWAMSS
jgi:hypothetical protein